MGRAVVWFLFSLSRGGARGRYRYATRSTVWAGRITRFGGIVTSLSKWKGLARSLGEVHRSDGRISMPDSAQRDGEGVGTARTRRDARAAVVVDCEIACLRRRG